MAKIDLSNMSYAELLAHRDEVDAALIAAKKAETEAFKQEVVAMAAKAGLSLEEVLGNGIGGKRGGKGSKVEVKYRNPQDPAQAWTGRGRKPLWMVDALNKGKELDDMRV